MTSDRLTLSSLQRIAGKKLGDNPTFNSAILLARALAQRPRLIDAITDQEGYITRESLSKAERVVFGNSDPGAFSPDPFHAKSNAELVQVFKVMFTELRDRSRDRKGFFELIGYVNIELLVAMSKDPDELDGQGQPVLDPVTGLARKKYDEQQVYMAKNIVDRPGLLQSLESAHGGGRRMFGSHHQEGWLSNKSLDRWLEHQKVR
ncbi:MULTISPECIES: type III secretion effector protein [unclassified Pseudomonas]|uniref:type III secretion effector protein n=1 Tax=unclassified Pseudomonas TaxID=196821 RepID=UPI0015A0E8A2|nr:MULTISPECIES: type III secretion effector protein [unclassified Pseudomonas]NWC96273.1 type III secretion effector protein [Pseudomonas sp. IPO3779]NWD15458.1 type III secretion effector protein [Pseudomonas sp. IPO3778]